MSSVSRRGTTENILGQDKNLSGTVAGLTHRRCSVTFADMNDAAIRPGAWNISPEAYVATRPATFVIPQPSSCYVAMRDGCRLAVDVYLPQGASAPARFPTIA